MRNDLSRIFDQADHADDGRRQNAAAVGFVVKRDVAGNDRRFKGQARLGYAVNDLGKAPHHFGPFGRGEVKAIGDGNRLGTDADNVAGGFGDGEAGPFARIDGGKFTAAVETHRDRAAGFFNANDSGVGTRQNSRVRPHHSVVLFVNPAF